jgi:hypothetical protein
LSDGLVVVTTGRKALRDGLEFTEIADITSLVLAIKMRACAAHKGLAQCVTGAPLYARI